MFAKVSTTVSTIGFWDLFWMRMMRHWDVGPAQEGGVFEGPRRGVRLESYPLLEPQSQLAE